MDLREKILKALYGSALVSAAAISVTACSDEAAESNQSTNGWTINHAQGDMSSPRDMTTTPPVDMGGPVEDMNGRLDYGLPPADFGQPDMPGPVDLGAPDYGMPDYGQPDYGMPDSGLPDFGQPDMPPSNACSFEDAVVTLPYDNWEAEAYNYARQRVIVCGDRDPNMACQQGSSMTPTERNEFLLTSMGVENNCSGDPEPYVVNADTFCGPVPISRTQCCYALEIDFSFCAVGRPFTVGGEVRFAEVTRRDGWCDPLELEGLDELPLALRQEIAAAWAESGTHEHASVASFGRFLMDLMSLGAPRELVQATTTAIEDEIRHAHHCFSVASAYAGMTLGPDVVDVHGSMDHAGDEAVILRDAILEGCIGETLAASVAQWMAPRSKYPEVQEILEGISVDEGEHAVLAWQFVDWMLTTRPYLVDIARETFESVKVNLQGSWAAGMDHLESVAVEHGRLRPATEEQLRLSAYNNIVKPCAEALFAQHSTSQPSHNAMS